MIAQLVFVVAVAGGWMYWLDKTNGIKTPWLKLGVRLVMVAACVWGILE